MAAGEQQEGGQEEQQQTWVEKGQETAAQSTNQSLMIQTDNEDEQITTEVFQADLPSPGRVVLMLPDISFMMTKVNDKQYQGLNLVN